MNVSALKLSIEQAAFRSVAVRFVKAFLVYLGFILLAFAGIVWQSYCSKGFSAKADEAHAQETDFFAPGAKGVVEGLDVETILERARREGEEMRERNLAVPDLEWNPQGDVERNLANNPGARAELEAMLGLEPGSSSLPASERRQGATVLVFASFSMPDEALRKLGHDATKAGATLLLQGFLNNSATDMAVAINRVFGGETEVGFAVDPTAFNRFEVKAVPTVIALARPLVACKTRHCASDEVPAHDRIAGNASLDFMLEALAARGDAAVFQSSVALDRLRSVE